MFKRIIAGALCLSLSAACLGSCGLKDEKKANGESKKIKVVCSSFAEYDWAKEIIGDHKDSADISYLLDSGVDLHSYQPTADDIIKIGDSDLFICVGGESEEWVNDALKESLNKDIHVINLLETLGSSAKQEEVKEGMEADEDEEEDGEEEVEYDEHVWLSLKNAELFCDKISEELCSIDQKNAEDYKANLKAYKEKLSKLDGDIEELVKNSDNKTLIFGDRFPFRYFVEDYNLDYYAAFVGCSAETEASFKTVAFLAAKIDELGAKNVFTIENSDQKIAKSIVENTKDKDAKIVTLNSIQSVTKKQIEDGTSYLSLMQENYNTLKEALK